MGAEIGDGDTELRCPCCCQPLTYLLVTVNQPSRPVFKPSSSKIRPWCFEFHHRCSMKTDRGVQHLSGYKRPSATSDYQATGCDTAGLHHMRSPIIGARWRHVNSQLVRSPVLGYNSTTENLACCTPLDESFKHLIPVIASLVVTGYGEPVFRCTAFFAYPRMLSRHVDDVTNQPPAGPTLSPVGFCIFDVRLHSQPQRKLGLPQALARGVPVEPVDDPGRNTSIGG